MDELNDIVEPPIGTTQNGENIEPDIVAWCYKCRKKTVMLNPELVSTKARTYCNKGLCKICGAKQCVFTKYKVEPPVNHIQQTNH